MGSKSITESAYLFYTLLEHSKKVLVVCNKADLQLAKNMKRLKLQIRTELERLRKARLGSLNSEEKEILSPSFNLDTSEGLPCKISFVQSSSVTEHEGLQEIRRF